MATHDLPSKDCRTLGANPYAETVVEEASGRRWVKTSQGWLPEDRCESLRVCRAKTVDDAHVAMASMCVAPIAMAFKQNWLRAYVVWSSPAGQPTPSNVKNPEAAKRFAEQVVRLQAEHGWRQWVGDAPQAWGRLKWAHVVQAVGPDGWPMGMVAGMARRIAKRGEEWGLSGAGASLGLHGWRCDSRLRSTWPTPPDGRVDFHGHNGRSVPRNHDTVLWCNAARRRAWPDRGLTRWFDWWSKQGHGWWITDDPAGPLALEFSRQLAQAGKPWTRHTIKHGASVMEAWEIGQGATPDARVSYSLESWAQDPPQTRVDRTHDDRDGRRPYVPASDLDPSEAWAPTGLVEAMEDGLSALSAVYGSVDKKVASLLDRPVETLGEVLSAEQVDGVAMAAARLEEGRAFLLADETGYGKGRALASLALAGLAQGRTVVILTERKQLFSDLYRDLTAVSKGPPPKPLLFHGQADIRNAQGKVEVESLKGKKYQELLKKHAWDAGQPHLVFSTYAQLARGKVPEKMAWLAERMGKGAWLLLDESHNAAGPSQVGEQVDKLIGRAGGVVHASATFVRGEGNLSAYRRALPWGPSSLPWIKSALAHDPGPLRQALVEEIARAGLLLRREHAPVPPPSTVWVPPSAEQEAAMSAFVQTWQGIFAACEQWEIAQSGRTQLAWMKIGAVMSRSVREFLLWLKAQALVDRMVEIKALGQKSVIAVDSTMEAALREALDARAPTDQDELSDDQSTTPQGVVAEGPGSPPFWRDRWVRLLDELVPEDPSSRPKVIAARKAALEAIAKLPEWSLSPLDWVADQASSRGVRVSEISGRNTRLEILPGGWKVSSRTGENRTEVVRRFNEGELDSLLLTRAAASGISLHAGRQFKDQSPRVLIEWGVAADPLVRMQFWGRVRRRDQVIEPSFESLAFDTPSERRLRARDERKRRQLSAHLGAGDDGEVDLLSPLGESLVDEWAKEHPAVARRLGVYRAMPDDPVGRIDRILARSMVLPEQQRTNLIERLDFGLAASADYYRASSEPSTMSSRQVRSTWWWGDAQSPSSRVEGVWPWRLDWVERAWLPQANTGVDRAVECLSKVQGEDGPAVLARWKSVEAGRAPRGPAHASHLRWAASILPSLRKGFAVQVADPVSGQPTKAMVLDVKGPDSPDSESWALSQVSVLLLRVGAQEPLRTPLRALFSDRHFKVANAMAKPAWFGEDLSPVRSIVVEGNPLAAAAWGRRIGQGWSQMLHDETGDTKIVWRMPPQCTWESMHKLPRDLMAVEQVFSFWRDFPDEPVAAALPLGQSCIAQPIPGNILFKFDQETYAKISEEWLDAALGKMLSAPRQHRSDNKVWVVRGIEWKMARRWFEAAAIRGLGWRVSAKHAAWYEKACHDWFQRMR